MKKNKVLLGAVAAIALCVCMLVGATYAWLTDEVVSGTNVVKSGSLTVGVEYTLDGENWADLNGADDLFENAVWEPGYTKVIALRVTNKGNVALKFGWGINYVGETKGVNKAGEEYSLSKYLECAYSAMQEWDEDNVIAQIYLQIAFDRDGQKAIGWTKTSFEEMCAMQQGGSTLAPGQQVIGMMKIYMPETLGNEVNARTPEEAAEIKMGIAVVATQAPVESDGFDNKYDEGALLPNIKTVSSDEETEGALTEDTAVINVALTKDVTFDVKPYDQKPMGGESTKLIIIEGNGHKLTFNNTNSDWNNITWGSAKLIIKNATIDNSGYNADGAAWNSHNIYFNGDVELENVKFANAVAISGTAKMTNVSIEDAKATQDTYMLWIVAGSTVTMENCTINGKSTSGKANRAIAIKDQYVSDPGMTTLSVKGGKISSDKYAAVLVTSAGGAKITMSGVDISATQDAENAVWYDGNGENVTVTGCTKKAR